MIERVKTRMKTKLDKNLQGKGQIVTLWFFKILLVVYNKEDLYFELNDLTRSDTELEAGQQLKRKYKETVEDCDDVQWFVNNRDKEHVIKDIQLEYTNL